MDGLAQRTIDVGRRVLIADDSQSSRDLLRFILQRCGCEVVEAQHGAQAVVLALQFTPHLLILDLSMPQLDGYEVASKLRNLPSFANTPILALSAGTVFDPARAHQAAFSALLYKPIAPAELRLWIRQLLAAGQFPQH